MCPWNVKFSRDAAEQAFAARAVIAGKEAQTLAAEPLAMEKEEVSAASRRSAVKRAKRAGLKRNARVVLDNTRHSTS